MYKKPGYLPSREEQIELVKRTKVGDLVAGERLSDICFSLAKITARSFEDDYPYIMGEVDDVANNSFYIALDMYTEVQGAKFTSLAARIIKNTFIDMTARSHKKRMKITYAQSLNSDHVVADLTLEEKERPALLETFVGDLFERLPEDRRNSLRDYFGFELSAEDRAKMRALPYNKLRAIRDQARRQAKSLAGAGSLKRQLEALVA